jgi:hypothetical protein
MKILIDTDILLDVALDRTPNPKFTKNFPGGPILAQNWPVCRGNILIFL